MQRHGTRRSRPAELQPGTVRVIAVRMDYSPPEATDAWQVLEAPPWAMCRATPLGRDYHKADARTAAGLADRHRRSHRSLRLPRLRGFGAGAGAGLGARGRAGWVGKHTILLHRQGSWFFLGELLPTCRYPWTRRRRRTAAPAHAASKSAPRRPSSHPIGSTRAAASPYLTIELHGAIPHEFRRAMGNHLRLRRLPARLPWNKFARVSAEADFRVRHASMPRPDRTVGLEREEFLRRTEGSAIRRIGHERWLRNVAVALGNARRAAPPQRRCARADHPRRWYAARRLGAGRAGAQGHRRALTPGRGLIRSRPRVVDRNRSRCCRRWRLNAGRIARPGLASSTPHWSEGIEVPKHCLHEHLIAHYSASNAPGSPA